MCISYILHVYTSDVQGCCYDNSSHIPLARCYYAVTSYQDLYFFGHGHGKMKLRKYLKLPSRMKYFFTADYKLALKEFTMVSACKYCPPKCYWKIKLHHTI